MTSHDHAHHKAKTATADTAIDPVCGMSVAIATSKLHTEHHGVTYHFCSPSCQTKFTNTPAKYLTEIVSVDAMPDGTIFTCPMHPQIRQIGPGSCPICGMAMVHLTVTADSGPNPELADMTRRFWIGLALALPVFILEMAGHLTGLAMMIGQQLTN
jgi:YHS domain-containing protein